MVKTKAFLPIAALAALALTLGTTSAFAEEAESPTTVEEGKEAGPPAPGGLTEEEYLSLSYDEQLALKTKELEAGPQDEAAIAEISKTGTPFNAATLEFSDQIFAIGDKYPAVYSRFEVDSSTETITLGFAEAADKQEITNFQNEVRGVLDAYPYKVNFVPKDYNRYDLQTVSDELTDDFETWGPRFGGKGYASEPDFKATGTVQVSTEGIPDEKWTNFEYKGVKVNVASVDGPAVNLQSRYVDYSPHFSGIALSNGPYGATPACTSGFSWTKWSGGGIYGSTAEHCWTFSGITTFGNNYSTVGTRSGTITRTYDTMLLNRPSGKSFGTSVYIGGPGTNTAWPVVGAASLPIGGWSILQAASGAGVSTQVGNTGVSYHVGASLAGTYTIKGISYTWSGDGTHCYGGDSGGPWVAAPNGPAVLANGQHLGGYRPTGSSYSYCSFIDINKISGALQATLRTA